MRDYSRMEKANWIKDYGAVVVAGVAAVVSIWNAWASWRARKDDWRRTRRSACYADFVGSVSELFSFYRSQKFDEFELETFRSLHGRYLAKLAEVLIVGPRSVSRAASVIRLVLEDYGELPRGAEVDSDMFDRAMNEFIAAASEALGIDEEQDDIDFNAWKRLSPPERAVWPKP